MPTAEREIPDLSDLLKQKAELDQIGAEILYGESRAIRYVETCAGGKSMVFVARHDDVVRVLKDEAAFSVGHYDPLYEAVAPPGAFLIMRPEDARRKERLDILDAAKAKTPWFEGDPARRRAVAKACVEEVLAAVSRRRRFDLIGEFGFFVPYLVGMRVLGLTGPRSFDPLALLVWFLNCHSVSKFFRPKTGPYVTDVAWSEFVIAQLIMNFENRQPLFRWLAAWGAKRLRAQVERLVDRSPGTEGDDTLLSALRAVRDTDFHTVDKDVYREHVVSILMELASTLLVVPGTGFSGIVTRWLEPGGPGLEDSLRTLKDMNAEDFVQEELRLAPPSAYLLRNATGPVEMGGLIVNEGEYVCALVKSAGTAIPDEPGAVKAGRCPNDYLHFGPSGGPHHCVGRGLAPSILAEMFLGLARLPGLKARGRPTSFKNSVPGRLIVDFGKSQMKRPSGLAQQPPFLICVPISNDKASPGDAAHEIEAMLDRFGNPAGGALKWALDATNVIHFLSLSVVRGDSGDPPVLVADIAADGEPRAIIAALVKYAGALLLPIFQAAAGVEDTRALERLLANNWVKPGGVALPPWPRSIWHRATGLAFQGTPGLTLKRVRDDEKIARAAKAAILGRTPSSPSAALSCLAAARTAVGIADPKGEPFAYSDAPPSLSRDGVLAFVSSLLGLIVLDWSFLFIILFVVLFLNIYDLFSPIMSNKTHDSQMMLVIPIAIVFGLIHNSIINITKSILPIDIKRNIRNLIAIIVVFSILVISVLAIDVSSVLYQWSSLDRYIHIYPFALWVTSSLGFLSLVMFLTLAAAALIGVLWWHESRDIPCDEDPDPALLAEIMRREDLAPHKQNHMIAVSTLSPGLFRRLVSLPVALYVASLTVRSGVFRTGYLSGIGTIHFIQWARIPGTGKLVFTANYDGSFQGYLEDAITQLPGGATGIWSNAVGFPKTKWLFADGATDGDRFKRWVRRQMIPTRFWYSAYPHLTATDIRLNAAIRLGLEDATITSSKAETWLTLFGSAPRPVSEIETDQIQGLAFGGYRNLLEGAVLAISFPENQADCRAWLASVSGRTDFGEARPSQSAMAVALSARGLERLGLGAAERLAARFSPAFAMGMASDARANVLGDVAGNAPGGWEWGGPDRSVDAVLLIYAVDRQTLEQRLKDETTSCTHAGMASPHTIVLHRWPPSSDPKRNKKSEPITEPFGFVDGISQPSIRGLLSSRGALEADLLEPGEFILGYPDGRQQFPPTPQVFASDDPDKLLPDLPPNFPPPPSRQAVRDLGRNGSYLVIRQLKQDVSAFKRYLEEAAGKAGMTPDGVAAKMVGRWYNGAPLVLFPHSAPKTYDTLPKDEDFLFGRDDPQGLACPFGAHIRRANPRDQFAADDKTQMSITNRHRILRRGRSYVDGDDSTSAAQGLLFMCLNADIERQFEFLQQTWIGSSSFGPLRDEADPLTALNRTDGIYTIPRRGSPTQLTGMPSFVSVIGGGYFFLPGRQALTFLSR